MITKPAKSNLMWKTVYWSTSALAGLVLDALLDLSQ